jgi:PAS domain S-box-containing protein
MRDRDFLRQPQVPASDSRGILSDVLAGPGSLRSVLVAACKCLYDRTRVAAVRIWTIDDTGVQLRLDASWNGDSRLDTKPARIPVGAQRVGHVAATLQPFVVDDITEQTDRDRCEWPEPEGLTAFGGFPLLGEGRLLGVLAAGDRKPFDGSSLEILRASAQEIAAAILRKHAEEHARASQARKAAILQSALDAIITIDHESRVLEFNPAAERMFGYTLAEVLNRSLADLIVPPPLREAHRRGMQHYLATGEGPALGKRIEIEAMHADGTIFPVELAITVVPLDGPPVFTAYLRDIRLRQQAAREIARSNELLDAIRRIQLQYISEGDSRTLFDTMLSLVLRTTGSTFGFVGEVKADGDGRPVMKPLALSANGWDESTRRQNDEQDADERAFQDLVTHFGRVMTTGRAVISSDLPDDPRRGGLPPAWPPLEHFACVPLDAGGHVVGMIGLANRPGGYDEALIAECEPLFSACAGVLAGYQEFRRRRAAEESLAAAKERAEEANRAKSDFLANMSHEVRTPMAAVLGYADMLLEPALPPAERDQALQGIRRNGEHLMHLIDDILDLSKIEAGKLVLEAVPVAPRSLLHEVLSLHRGKAMEKGVRLEARIAGRLPSVIHTDPIRVRQVLVNLVSNAIKFTPDGGGVLLELQAEPLPHGGAELVLAVEDNGIGMSKRHIAQLFQPFQQADSSTTRRYGGSGLGLSISKRLVDALGGSISVESRIGIGSRFTVRLPVPVESEAHPWELGQPVAWDTLKESGVQAEERTWSLRGSVLVVEDSPDIRQIVTRLLEAEGLEVSVAEDGLQAIETVERRPFDLILMDMQMPRLDGYGAASSLRLSGYAGPIVALTAHALFEDRDRCLRAGCTDYLTKPVDRRILMDCVRRHIGTGRPTAPTAVGARSDEQASFDDEFAALVCAYRESLRETAGLLEQAIAAGDRQSLLKVAHQTRGVAGMYGFHGLTETAGLLEDALREDQDDELIQALTDELVAVIRGILRES